MRAFKTTLLILGFGLIAVPAVHAQDMPPPGQQQQEVDLSDKELKTFAVAYLALSDIREEMTAQLDAVQSAEEAQAIQQEANTKMVSELEEHGFTAEEYTVVVTALNEDEELRNRFEETIAELIEEEDTL